MAHPFTYIVKAIGEDVNALDNNPRVQLKIHTVGFWYWTINFPIIAGMFFFEPKVWFKWGLFITLIYSIYANWTSDYTGMSSAQSVINTENNPNIGIKETPFPGAGIIIDNKEK